MLAFRTSTSAPSCSTTGGYASKGAASAARNTIRQMHIKVTTSPFYSARTISSPIIIEKTNSDSFFPKSHFSPRLSVFRACFSCSIFCTRQSYFIIVPHKSIQSNSDWGPSALERRVSTALVPYFITHHHSHILTHTHILTFTHTHAFLTYCNDILATPARPLRTKKLNLPPLQ